MKQEQLYLKVEDVPNFDKEDLINLEVPIYKFNDVEYIKINITDNFKNEDWEKYNIIDIELYEMKENENAGEFNGMGNTAKKDFFPLNTELIIKENNLK